MGKRRGGSRECKSLGWRGHLQSPRDILQGHLATWRSAPLWKQLQLLQDHFTSNRHRQVKLLFTLLIRTSRKQWAAWRERTKPYLIAHLPWEHLALIPKTSSYNNLSSPPPPTNLQVTPASSDVLSVFPNTSLPQRLGTSVSEPDRCPKKSERKENLD